MHAFLFFFTVLIESAGIYGLHYSWKQYSPSIRNASFVMLISWTFSKCFLELFQKPTIKLLVGYKTLATALEFFSLLLHRFVHCMSKNCEWP